MLSKLGIDVRLLVWQMVNFVILFVILRRFAWKPIIAMLRKRTAESEQAAADSRAASDAKKNAEAESMRIIREAQERASAIIRTTAEEADATRAEKITAATAEAAAILSAARAGIEEERARAMRDAERELGAVVIEATRKVLGGMPPPADLDRTVRQLLGNS